MLWTLGRTGMGSVSLEESGDQAKAELKRQARYRAVEIMVDNFGSPNPPDFDGWLALTEKIAKYLAHGSMPEPKQD